MNDQAMSNEKPMSVGDWFVTILILGIPLVNRGTGIRTLGGLSPSSVFKTGAFDHSATPPTKAYIIARN